MEQLPNTEIYSFTNIDDKDFVGYWGGKGQRVAAGQTVMVVGYLAEHYAKHLANQILIKKGEDWNDESLRRPLLDKILSKNIQNTETIEAEKPAEKPTEETAEEFADLES